MCRGRVPPPNLLPQKSELPVHLRRFCREFLVCSRTFALFAEHAPADCVARIADPRDGGVVSRSAEQYRDLAQLYLDIARSLPHGEQRVLLVDAAQTYLQLAEEQGAAISPPSVDETQPTVQQQQQTRSNRKAAKE